jgi:hypothetical protein
MVSETQRPIYYGIHAFCGVGRKNHALGIVSTKKRGDGLAGMKDNTARIRSHVGIEIDHRFDHHLWFGVGFRRVIEVEATHCSA